jgi:hypothetical protein
MPLRRLPALYEEELHVICVHMAALFAAIVLAFAANFAVLEYISIQQPAALNLQARYLSSEYAALAGQQIALQQFISTGNQNFYRPNQLKLDAAIAKGGDLPTARAAESWQSWAIAQATLMETGHQAQARSTANSLDGDQLFTHFAATYTTARTAAQKARDAATNNVQAATAIGQILYLVTVMVWAAIVVSLIARVPHSPAEFWFLLRYHQPKPPQVEESEPVPSKVPDGT